jgi:hypothetical protein
VNPLWESHVRFLPDADISVVEEINDGAPSFYPAGAQRLE